MPKTLSPEIIEQIKSMSEKRIEQKVIAETLGISIPTVSRYQRHFNINASNRYNGGAISQSMQDDVVTGFRKAEQRNGADCERQPREWCMVAEKVVTMVGIDTGFIYTMGTKMDHIKITTNNSEDITVSLEELVAFGNEILDVAESVQKIKSNVWEF